MSLPMKTEVFMHFGQSATPRLSATLDGLSRDIGRLCGCILLNPGIFSSRQEQTETSLYGNKFPEKYIDVKRHTLFTVDSDCVGSSGNCSYRASWALIILCIFLHPELQ